MTCDVCPNRKLGRKHREDPKQAMQGTEQGIKVQDVSALVPRREATVRKLALSRVYLYKCNAANTRKRVLNEE